MKTLPEPEASSIRSTLVYKGELIEVLCDVYDLLDCESTDCALELYDSYLQKHISDSERALVSIENIKGGKIFVYRIGGDVVCLCIHRAEVDCKAICDHYMK